MDRIEFFAHIDATRPTRTELGTLRLHPRTFDETALMVHGDRLHNRLRDLPAQEVRSFAEHMAAEHRSLHTREMQEAISLCWGSCTDTEFEAFRTWVILAGRTKVDAAAADADSIADLPHLPHPSGPVFEQATAIVLGAADTVHQDATGEPTGVTLRPTGPPTGDRHPDRTARELYPNLSAHSLEPPAPWRTGAATVVGPTEIWGPGPFDNDRGLATLAFDAHAYAILDPDGVVDPDIDLGPASYRYLAEEFTERFELLDTYADPATDPPRHLAQTADSAYAVAGLVAAALAGHRPDDPRAFTRRATVDPADPTGLAHHWGYVALLTPGTAETLRDQAAATLHTLSLQRAWIARHPTPGELRTHLRLLAEHLTDTPAR